MKFFHLPLAFFFLAVCFQVKAVAQPSIDSCAETVTDSFVQKVQTTVSMDTPVAEEEIHPVKTRRQPVFLFIVFAMQIAMFAYLRASFPKSLTEIARSLMNLTMAQQLFREQQLSMPVSAIFYNINFVFSGGVFLYLLNRQYGWMGDFTPVVSLLFFLWLVIVLYSLKYGSMKLVAWVFPFGNEVNYYSFNYFIVQKVAGIALIPANMLIAYAPEPLRPAIIVLAFILTGIAVLGTVLKGLEISRNLLQQDTFHFFIYICTLEIAPVCILVKVVAEWLS